MLCICLWADTNETYTYAIDCSLNETLIWFRVFILLGATIYTYIMTITINTKATMLYLIIYTKPYLTMSVWEILLHTWCMTSYTIVIHTLFSFRRGWEDSSCWRGRWIKVLEGKWYPTIGIPPSFKNDQKQKFNLYYIVYIKKSYCSKNREEGIPPLILIYIEIYVSYNFSVKVKKHNQFWICVFTQ